MDDARKWLWREVREPGGAICPCCQRFDKVYRRKIPAPAIRALIKLYQLGPGAHPYDAFLGYSDGGEFARLAHLGLVRNVGSAYEILNRGKAFVEGRRSIPKSIVLYHNALLSVSVEERWIGDFYPLFDYHELMNTGVEE